MEDFGRLLAQRWAETCQTLHWAPGEVQLTWEITPAYPHFNKPRGYGVTLHSGGPAAHLGFAPKILQTNQGRQDGVIRHELGHVVDCVCEAKPLNAWAARRGVKLAKTQERRADDIARAIWKTPIRYDRKLLVQTTGRGHYPRPRHLGL